MKKILAVLLAALMLCMTALADTSFDLLARWEQDGYPEDVTGVFYNAETSSLSILLTENTLSRRMAIANSVEDGSMLLFFDGDYSHAELIAVQNAIAEELSSGETEGLLKVTLGWGVHGGFGDAGKDFRVVAEAADEQAEQLAARYAAEYGDIVVVEKASEWRAAEEAAQQAEEQAAEQAAARKGGLSDWTIIGIFAAVLVVGIITLEIITAKRKKEKEQGGSLHL